MSAENREMPAVLTSPPWRDKKKPPSPITFSELPKVEFVEKVHWNEGEREKALEPYRSWSSRSRTIGADWRHIPLYEIHGLDDEAALELWNETDPVRWCYAMKRDVLAILARFGAAGAKGLIRYATLSSDDGFCGGGAPSHRVGSTSAEG